MNDSLKCIFVWLKYSYLKLIYLLYTNALIYTLQKEMRWFVFAKNTIYKFAHVYQHICFSKIWRTLFAYIFYSRQNNLSFTLEFISIILFFKQFTLIYNDLVAVIISTNFFFHKPFLFTIFWTIGLVLVSLIKWPYVIKPFCSLSSPYSCKISYKKPLLFHQNLSMDFQTAIKLRKENEI